MIAPVLQFIYQWTLNPPIAGGQNDGNGQITYIYRSNKILDALTGEDIWGINIYKGDGNWTKTSGCLETKDTNEFINKHKI